MRREKRNEPDQEKRWATLHRQIKKRSPTSEERVTAPNQSVKSVSHATNHTGSRVGGETKVPLLGRHGAAAAAGPAGRDP